MQLAIGGEPKLHEQCQDVFVSCGNELGGNDAPQSDITLLHAGNGPRRDSQSREKAPPHQPQRLHQYLIAPRVEVQDK